MLKSLIAFLTFLPWVISCQNSTPKAVCRPGEPIFQVEKAGRLGFINQKGEEVIEPIFRNVGLFTDSLAPARLNGSWGFINLKGQFVIHPVFDYAERFSEGYAVVWTNGKPGFIDEKGRNQWALPDSIVEINGFERGKAKFTAMQNGQRRDFILNKEGKIVSDEHIEFSEGLAVITREVPSEDDEGTITEYAVRDSAGKMVVPFGRYTEIEPFKNGFAEISINGMDPDDYKIGFINRTGVLKFILPKGSFVFDNYFSEERLGVTAQLDPGCNCWSSSETYIVWYDTTGKVVFVKNDDHKAMPFKNGRTFSGEIRNWYLMDRNGTQMGKNRFKWVADDDFSDNMAIVARNEASHGLPEIDRGRLSDSNYIRAITEKYLEDNALPEIDWYGIIDSMGNYVVEPRFNAVHEALFQQEGLLVAINEPLRKEHKSPDYKPIKQFWGLVNRDGSWVFPPRLTYVSPKGFENGLLYAELDSLYGYVNPEGTFVWSAIRKKNPQPELLNVDFMLRASCYAYESGLTADWAKGRNKALPGAQAKGFAKNEFGIYVNAKEQTIISGQFRGITAYVYNTKLDTFSIDVQDNRLYIVAQALNRRGEWQDVEYNPSSWCGNSYYDIKLAPDECWKFDIPIYDGDFPTMLRLKFDWTKRWTNDGEEIKTIYSNTFPGKINPGQFWRKQGHTPGNLMDPYLD